MNRKAYKVICTSPCKWSGCFFKKGDVKVFYSEIKRKQFLEKAPKGFFIKWEKRPENQSD